MANAEHLNFLQQGIATWNEWREKDPWSWIDLSSADLGGAVLAGAQLQWANLSGADLSQADLSSANLSNAVLGRADLNRAHLGERILATQTSVRRSCSRRTSTKQTSAGQTSERRSFTSQISAVRISVGRISTKQTSVGHTSQGRSCTWQISAGQVSAGRTSSGTDLSKANLSEANLSEADLKGANFSEANLRGANLTRTRLIETDIRHADLTGSSIYGIAAWDVKLTSDTRQENLVITPHGEPVIMVDNIKVAQFIYLLLNNEEVRSVIDSLTSKAVLILGRFSPERKIILDRLREELRTRHYLPMLFDFEKPKSRDTMETIRTLAGMSKFIIADLTDAKAVVQELQAIVPNLPSVAVRFIIQRSEREPGMFDHIRRFPWVVDGAFEYENPEEVMESINDNILKPVEAKLKELSF
jgi:uncharacterized protein YjbI with pentapeptide repeats